MDSKVGVIFSTGLMIAVVAGCTQNQAAGGFSPPPMPVEVADVVSGSVLDRFEAVGTIEAINSITVVSEVDALVRELPFREGAPIKQGELIAQLDDSQLRAQLARAEAIRDQKKATYDRVKPLFDNGKSSPQEHDDALAALRVAEADIAVILAQIAKTKIVAPFSGVTGSRRVSPGALVRANTPITSLVALDKLEVRFTAPERYYAHLKRGAIVNISTTAFPGYELQGTIEVIEPVVDQATRSARVIAHVNNPAGKFRPGMSANVSAVLAERSGALLVPDEAIFGEGNRNLVFVVKPDSTVVRTAILIGSRQRQTVEVIGGLEPGQKVVRAGHQKLFDGAKVMPIPSAPPQADQNHEAGGGTFETQ